MSEPVDPVRRINPDRRQKARRGGGDARDPQAAVFAVPVAAAPPAADPVEAATAEAAFTAHLLGQPGQKRGLRAGQTAIDSARAAYLEAEWSGPGDRRIPVGKVKRSEI
ncbi:MAG: hypothetical protein ACXW3D_03695 [Caulobacteraceae bacterium]